MSRRIDDLSPRFRPLAVEFCCRTCNVELTEDNWFPSDKKRNSKLCKKCAVEYSNKWKAANRERYSETQRAWAKRERPRLRAAKRAEKLRRVYGLTLEQFDAMFKDQSGRCANTACGAHGSGVRWCIDHDHATGIVRGILCNACNVSAGQQLDSPDRLRGLAEYLEVRRVAKAG